MERRIALLTITIVATLSLWFLINPSPLFSTIEFDGTTTTTTSRLIETEHTDWTFTGDDIPVIAINYNVAYNTTTKILIVSGDATLTNLGSVTSASLTKVTLDIFSTITEVKILVGTYQSFSFSINLPISEQYECDLKVNAEYILGGTLFGKSSNKRFFVTVEESTAYIDITEVDYDVFFSFLGLITFPIVSIVHKKRKLKKITTIEV